MLGRPPGAGAATLEPCESTNPTGPIITLEGDLTLEPRQATRRALRLSGIRQVLVKPANGFTGRPVFPVGKVRYGKSPRISLKGGITLVRKKRRAPLRSLHVLSKPGKPAYLRARAGGRTITFLVVKGGKRKFVARKGQLSRIGAARLTAAGARLAAEAFEAQHRRETAWLQTLSRRELEQLVRILAKLSGVEHPPRGQAMPETDRKLL